MSAFADGMEAIVASQGRVALNYFEDGSVEAACPPLKALLHIMAYGGYEGMTVTDSRFRALFTREAVLASDWYTARLQARQRKEAALWKRHIKALEAFRRSELEAPAGMDLEARFAAARRELERVSSPAYLNSLVGTIGADPCL
jgi:phosphoenolpyruvate carboxykinase (diphosphate)